MGEFGTQMCKVIKEATGTDENEDYYLTLVGILDKPIKTFDPDNVNLDDIINANYEQKRAEGYLTELGHVLEDCKLNAAEMIKVTKLFILWRQYRRYYKTLNLVQNEGCKDFRKLKTAMKSKKHMLTKYVEKSKKSKHEIFETIKFMSELNEN